eukprot:ANDGO_05033.mRNA.1 Ankyrin repeat and KH domain-containing protein mask
MFRHHGSSMSVDGGASLGPSSMEDVFRMALQNNDIAQVQACIASGMSVETQFDFGKTPLMIAAERGYSAIVELLVVHGAKVLSSDEAMKFPIMHAAEHGHLDIVKFLAKNGAALDIHNFRGHSALTLSIIHNHLNIVRWLLDAGADVNSPNDGGFTPLMMAAEKGFLLIVQLLVDRGADITARTKRGHTALSLAKKYKRDSVVSYLQGLQNHPDHTDDEADAATASKERRESIASSHPIAESAKPGDDDASEESKNRTSRRHVTIMKKVRSSINLTDAARQGVVAAVHHVLEMQDDVDGTEALVIAVEKGFPDIAQVLLEKGTSADARNAAGDPLLLISYRLRNRSLSELLLSWEASPLVENKHGMTPLALAASEGNLEWVAFYVQKGAPANGPFASGKIPLLLAAAHGHEDVVRYLVDEANASVHIKNTSGVTALMQACWNGYWSIAAFLLAHGADAHVVDEDGDTALSKACQHGHVAVVEHLLLEHNVAVNTVHSVSGMTPLMLACQGPHARIVQLLLDHGASIFPKTKKSKTALLYAVKSSNWDVVELLLQRNAEVIPGQQLFKDALLMAAGAGHAQVVRLLLDRGVPIESKNHCQATPLIYAVEQAPVINVTSIGLPRQHHHSLPTQHSQAPPARQAGHMSLISAHSGHGSLHSEGFSADQTLVQNDLYVPAVSTSIRVSTGTSDDAASTERKAQSEAATLEKVHLDTDDADSCGGDAVAAATVVADVVAVDVDVGHVEEPAASDLRGKSAVVSHAKAGEPHADAEHPQSASTPDNGSASALHKAELCLHPPGPVANGLEEVLTLLLDRGANVNAHQYQRRTALHIAVEKGYASVVKLLLARGANPNATAGYHTTPLMIAAAHNQVEIVRYLISSGADTALRDEQEMSAVSHAAQKRHVDVLLVLLLDSDAEMDGLSGYSFLLNSVFGFFSKSRFLEKIAKGNIPLEAEFRYAALVGTWFVVKLLAQQIPKHNVDIPSPYGNTALILAAALNHIDVAKYLIDEAKCNIDLVNLDGMTALHVASSLGHLSMVKLLVERGASSKTVDNRRRTAARCAKEAGQNDIVEFLKDA